MTSDLIFRIGKSPPCFVKSTQHFKEIENEIQTSPTKGKRAFSNCLQIFYTNLSFLCTNHPPPSSLLTSPPPRRIHTIIKRIPTKRTGALVARREPLVQTVGVEEVIAGLASLVRGLLIRPDDRVADGAFGVAFQSAGYVLLEGG